MIPSSQNQSKISRLLYGARDYGAWLNQFEGVPWYVPCVVQIGRSYYAAARFEHYMPNAPHAPHASQPRQCIQCLGPLPPSKRRRPNSLCYRLSYEGDPLDLSALNLESEWSADPPYDWYIACFYDPSHPHCPQATPEQEQQFHPFGPAFQLTRWEHDDPIDRFDQKYKRMNISLLAWGYAR